MSPSLKPKWAIVLGGLLGVIVVALGIWQFQPGSEPPPPKERKQVQTEPGESPFVTKKGPSQGPMASDARVRLQGRWQPPPPQQGTEPIRVLAQLEVAEGWHINANPASRDFLVPTQITMHQAGQTLKATAHYPEGQSLQVPLPGGESIQVYEGLITIPLVLERAQLKESTQLTLQARVQACNDRGQCLAPATLSTTLSAAEEPARP